LKKSYYGHGKLLITAEYYVLAGAKALAVPCPLGQSLTFESTGQKHLTWNSFDNQGQLWYQGQFELETFEEKTAIKTAVGKQLSLLLQATLKLNPLFLNQGGGIVNTQLEFDRNWGLGSSSTLLANMAQWAQINPFELSEQSFGGSGYDLSCASANGPIHYVRNNFSPKVTPVNFNPPFASRLFFVYQNTKQNSRTEIDRTRQIPFIEMEKINALTEAITNCQDQNEFNVLLAEHESRIGQYVKKTPIQQSLFNDFNGQIKSLGAWGGDFMLVSGDEQTINYFNRRGYNTIHHFEDMVLQRV
jgi:mevalonate kinase